MSRSGWSRRCDASSSWRCVGAPSASRSPPCCAAATSRGCANTPTSRATTRRRTPCPLPRSASFPGTSMGSAPAPHLANGWLSQFDKSIQGNSLIYFRYMDDIVQNVQHDLIQTKLNEINKLHKNLTFTSEQETEKKVSFLDMVIINNKGTLSSKWFRKATDTGLIMNFHSLAPLKYKKSISKVNHIVFVYPPPGRP